MAQQTLNNGELGNVWRGKVNDNFTEVYGFEGYIKNAAGTTGLFTEETANRLVGHSTGTTTALIFEMFEGGLTSVFQIDGNGTLLNNGYEYLRLDTVNDNILLGTGSPHSAITTIARNVFIGYLSGEDSTSNADNAFVGYHSGKDNTGGNKNTFLGSGSGKSNTTGLNNLFAGYLAGASQTANSNNTYLGYSSGTSNKQSGNVFLGNFSGSRQTALANTFFVDNQQRANAAKELTDSLMYGVFNADPTLQTLNVNAYQTIYTDSGELTTAGLKIEQAGAGDAKLSFALTGVKNYSMGIDNSTTNDDFILSFTTTLTTNPVMTVDGSSLDVTFVNDVIADNFTAEAGELVLKETTTPTPVTNYGKVYTKTDNKLYFQDGAGVEHLIVIEDTSGDVTITNEITAADFILA